MFPGVVVCSQKTRFEASRLQTGTFRYRTLLHGKDAGEGHIQIRKSRLGRLRPILEGLPRPISRWFPAGSSSAKRQPSKLAYAKGRVTSFAIDDPVAAAAMDQRIESATVMSPPKYRAGLQCSSHVYDPGTGSSAGLTKQIGKVRAVHMIYTIAKSKGAQKSTGCSYASRGLGSC